MEPVKPKIIEADWNFSKCPKAQLSFCLRYEYGRSSDRTIVTVRRWRKEEFVEADQPVKDNDQVMELEPMDFFRLFPEFPQTPWLALIPDVVKARLKALPKRELFLVRSVPVRNLEKDGEYQDAVEIIKPYETGTIQPVEVSWFFNDKKLIAAFKDWLKEHRPYNAREERGRTEPRVLLNALAAKRLLMYHRVSECMDITGAVLGKPLFKSDSDWYDAKARAEAHLAGQLPPLPVEKFLQNNHLLFEDGFTEAEVNQLWQYLIRLKVSQAKAVLRPEGDQFVSAMRNLLKKLREP